MRPIDLPACGPGHFAPLTHVGFRPDGKRLASCSYDGTVIVWDTGDPSRPTELARLRHRRLVNACAWNPVDAEVLATASADKTVAVWRVGEEGSGVLLTVLARHTDDINSVAWLPDGKRLICVSEDGRATLWSAAEGVFLREVGAHEAHCMMVSVSAQGLIATVGEDGLVAVSDPDGPGAPLTRRYDSSIEGCAWSHSGRLLAVARDDGAVDLLTTGLEVVRTVAASSSAARSVAWSEDDASFVVGAYDGALHHFDVAGRRLHRSEDRRMWPRSVTAARGVVAAGSFWNGPHLFDLATGVQLCAPAGATHGPNALAQLGGELLVGTDSGLVVAVPVDGSAVDGSAVDGSAVDGSAVDGSAVEGGGVGGGGMGGSAVGGGGGVDGSAVGGGGVGTGGGGAHTGPVRVIDFGPSPVLSLTVHDGVLFAGTYSGHVLRHDGTAVTSSAPLGAPVPSLTVHDGTLVAGTYNGEFLLITPDTLGVVERIGAHGGSVKSLAAVPGGFLSAATDRSVEAGGAYARSRLWEHGNLVNAVAVLGDQVAASASRDHTVKAGRITRLPGGTWRAERVQTLLGPDESVKCVALMGSAERPVVLAGSYDFGLYAWQVDWQEAAATLASGRVVAEFAQGLSCMHRLQDGTVAVAGWDGRILLVGVDSAGLPVIERSLHLGDLLTTPVRPAPVRPAAPAPAGRTAPVHRRAA